MDEHDNRDFQRGDIFWVDFSGEDNKGGCRGMHPAVIISNDTGNLYSRSLVVIPVTSAPKKPLPTHYTITGNEALREGSTVLCENITTVDKSQCECCAGRLTLAQMRDLEKCVRVALGL